MSLTNPVKLLLESLVESTIDGRLVWKPESDQTLTIVIDDVTFKFTAVWKLELNSGYTINNGWMSIKSKDLDLTIYKHDYPDLIPKLKDYFYKTYFHSKKPSEQKVIDQIDNITKKLSIQEYRDKKINSILSK
jgi:hypothetical protein